MEAIDKYNKDHLNDPKNRKPLEYYKGYYIDVIYRKICYRKTTTKQWMYPRAAENMPGHVLIFSARQLVAVNERAIANSLLGPYVPKESKPVVEPNNVISQVINNTKTENLESRKKKAQDVFMKYFADREKTATKVTEKKKMGRPKKEEKVHTVLNNAKRMQNMFDND